MNSLSFLLELDPLLELAKDSSEESVLAALFVHSREKFGYCPREVTWDVPVLTKLGEIQCGPLQVGVQWCARQPLSHVVHQCGGRKGECRGVSGKSVTMLSGTSRYRQLRGLFVPINGKMVRWSVSYIIQKEMGPVP